MTLDGAPATLLDLDAGDTAAAWYVAQTLIAAEAVGAIDVALATSVAYAKERHTFGRAIGSYQAVKHELVEMLRGLDNARSLMYYAGWAAQDKPDEFAARGVRVPARRRQGVRPRGARADLRARRHRRDVGARRAAVLPPRAAVPPAARRDGRRGGPRRGRAADPGARRRRPPSGRSPSAPRAAAGSGARAGRRAPTRGSSGRGSTVRRPATIASTPARATSAASMNRKPGSPLLLAGACAFSPNSVRVKPGHRQVTLTPVPPARRARPRRTTARTPCSPRRWRSPGAAGTRRSRRR